MAAYMSNDDGNIQRRIYANEEKSATAKRACAICVAVKIIGHMLAPEALTFMSQLVSMLVICDF